MVGTRLTRQNERMPPPLRYTLLTDGRSDQVLQHPIDWLLRLHVPASTFRRQWVDLATLPSPPKSLPQKCLAAVRLYPCELLVVHRDAEAQSIAVRKQEVARAIANAGLTRPPHVCLVPVRMTEAWFLFDTNAIRIAAGNPHGTQDLGLPPMHRFEQMDAKPALHQALRAASGHTGRKLRKFCSARAVHRLGESLCDFSPLRQLPSFRSFEEELLAVASDLAAN